MEFPTQTTRIFARVSFVAMLCGLAFAQPAFEVADVHVSARYHRTGLLDSLNPVAEGVLRAGRYEIQSATMLDLIRIAYGVDAAAVLGGPSWLEWDRFDVVAAAPASTDAETVKLMLRTLLADRFRLRIHNDTKPMTAYVLGTGKSPRLTRAESSENSGCVDQVAGSSACHNVTMAAFAAWLRASPRARSYVGANPVVDQTGLDGLWDFSIHWSPLAGRGADGVTLFDAIDKQPGLRLELTKVPMPVVVVDSVDEKPAANPPGVEARLQLPAQPTGFEVASIRPSAPGEPPMGTQIEPGGRVNLRGWPLNLLIWMAWDIADADESLAGTPKWLEPRSAPLFDIVAKAPVTSEGALLRNEDLRLMLRELLVNRFKMVTHYEDRPVTAYTLVAAKPKLKQADPSNRTGCKRELVPFTSEPGADHQIVRVQFTCRNITMAQFAEELQSIAPSYIFHPVPDATALDGAWDFALSFSQDNPANFAGRAPLDGDISLFEAVTRQLGLKLEMQKRPMPVLVIDHIEEKPTDN